MMMTKMINSCNKCDLYKSRSHISKDIGKNDASVLFVFDRDWNTDSMHNRQDLFIKRLNELLEWDWYQTYAIRCCTDSKITYEHIKSCRKYLGMVIKKVNPYLIILFGKVSVKMIFGEKYRNIPRNIFYSKTNKFGKKRIYFVAPRMTSPISALEKSFVKLYNYIQENYK